MSTSVPDPVTYVGVDYVAHQCRQERDWNAIVYRSPKHVNSKTGLVRGFTIELEPHVPPFFCPADFILEALAYMRPALEFALAEYSGCGTKSIKFWFIASVALDHVSSVEQKIPTLGSPSAELLLAASSMATELTKLIANGMPIEGMCMRIEGV